jgi:hypothetical protein
MMRKRLPKTDDGLRNLCYCAATHCLKWPDNPFAQRISILAASLR